MAKKVKNVGYPMWCHKCESKWIEVRPDTDPMPTTRTMPCIPCVDSDHERFLERFPWERPGLTVEERRVLLAEAGYGDK